jgi:hypothetical protein
MPYKYGRMLGNRVVSDGFIGAKNGRMAHICSITAFTSLAFIFTIPITKSS